MKHGHDAADGEAGKKREQQCRGDNGTLAYYWLAKKR